MPLSGSLPPESSASAETPGTALAIIAQTPFYQVCVDRSKNLLLLTFAGSWNTPEEVPFYLLHLKEALSLLLPGFSILSDIRALEEYAPAIRHMHLEAQRLSIEAGICQVAEVQDLNNPINVLVIAMAEECNIPLNIFDSLEDAEAWLLEI